MGDSSYEIRVHSRGVMKKITIREITLITNGDAHLFTVPTDDANYLRVVNAFDKMNMSADDRFALEFIDESVFGGKMAYPEEWMNVDKMIRKHEKEFNTFKKKRFSEAL
jgi:hypothetical protein